MREVTFPFKGSLKTSDLNQRFADLAGGSILQGFRLKKGTGFYSVSISRDGAAESILLTKKGVRLQDDQDAIDAIRVTPNTTAQDRYDAIYVIHDPFDKTFYYDIIEGISGDSVKLIQTPELRTAIGHVRVRPNQTLTQADLTSYPLGLRFGTTIFDKVADFLEGIKTKSLEIDGKKAASEEYAAAQALGEATAKANTALNDAKTYTNTKLDALVNSAPGTLDTLKEIADALGNDAQLSSKVIETRTEVQNARGGFTSLRERMDLQKYYVNVKEFGAKGDGVTDDTAAIQAARDFIASKENPPILEFPPGIYLYSSSPNWAIQDAVIEAKGDVRLRYTGNGTGIIFDGSSNVSPVSGNVFNCTFKGFKLEASSSCVTGVYVHALHHSKIDIRVVGCGMNGFHIQFAVCTEFWATVSANEEGWYLNARPYYGIKLSEKSSGLLPAYCTFYNPILEGTTEGTVIEESLGCIFMGGTMEGCLDSGLILEVGAGLNKFFGTDFEANGSNDVVIGGFENEFYSIDTIKVLSILGTGKRNIIQGGSHKNIVMEASSFQNILSNLKYNRELYDGTQGTITDAGTQNRITDCIDVKGNMIGNRPGKTTAIVPSASPFTYTNNSGNDELIMIFGGTVTNYQYIHANTGDIITTIPLYSRLVPGDKVVLNYTVAPTIKKYTT